MNAIKTYLLQSDVHRNRWTSMKQTNKDYLLACFACPLAIGYNSTETLRQFSKLDLPRLKIGTQKSVIEDKI